MKKFKVKPFKKWLDVLAAAIVKTRDGFMCQIVHDPACAGVMSKLDQNCQCCHIVSRKENEYRWDLLNLITGCAHCHEYIHRHPIEFGVWFAGKYPARIEYLNNKVFAAKTWREDDFLKWEDYLLEKAVDLKVDCLAINEAYRTRFINKIKERRTLITD